MNYSTALSKVEKLHELGKRLRAREGTSGGEYDDFALLYGEIEDLIRRLIPDERLEFKGRWGEFIIRNNYIEAGYLSDHGLYQEHGWKQLNLLLGKVRRLASDPAAFRPEASISAVVESIRRFRECCQFMREPPLSETAVQEILWIMLRAQFERIEREATLPRFGLRSYRPDFAIPDLQLLIEAKFVGVKADPAAIQESILADIPAYLAENASYQSVIVFCYDHAQKIRDSRKFIEDLRTVPGIVEVIVVPGIDSGQ